MRTDNRTSGGYLSLDGKVIKDYKDLEEPLSRKEAELEKKFDRILNFCCFALPLSFLIMLPCLLVGYVTVGGTAAVLTLFFMLLGGLTGIFYPKQRDKNRISAKEKFKNLYTCKHCEGIVTKCGNDINDNKLERKVKLATELDGYVQQETKQLASADSIASWEEQFEELIKETKEIKES